MIVLDFIGNYIKSDMVQKYLTSNYQSGRTASEQDGNAGNEDSAYPDDCQVDFDIKLIDMWQRLEKRNMTRLAMIEAEFQRISDQMDGHHPNRIQLFNAMDEEHYQLCMSMGKDNPFKDYLGFLKKQQCLTPDEQRIFSGYGHDFLNWLETTDMTRVYKMPVLQAFLQDGKIKSVVSRQEVLNSWKEFFANNRNWRDLPQVDSYQEYLKKTDKWHTTKIETMPVKYLKKSGASFLSQEPSSDERLLELNAMVQEILELLGLYQQVEDVLAYRVQHYYWRRYREKK